MKRLPKYLICALVIGLGVLAAAAFLNRRANSSSASVRAVNGADAATAQGTDPVAALSAMAVDSSTTEPRRRRWAGMVTEATATSTATSDLTESTVVHPAVENELTAAKIEVPGAGTVGGVPMVGDATSDVNGATSGSSSSGSVGIAPVGAIAAQGFGGGSASGGSAGGAGGMGLGLGSVQGGQVNDGLGGGAGGANGGSGTGSANGSANLSASNPSTSTGSGTTSETSGTTDNSGTSSSGNAAANNAAANNNNTASSGNASNGTAAANSSASSNSSGNSSSNSNSGGTGSTASNNAGSTSAASNNTASNNATSNTTSNNSASNNTSPNSTPAASVANNNSPATSEGPLAVTPSFVTPPVADLIAAAVNTNTTSPTGQNSPVAPGVGNSPGADPSADQGGLGNAQLTGSGLSSWDNPLVPDANGVFHLQVTDPAQQFFLDPPPAIGYDYLVLSGPFVASVTLPSFGDNLYDIYGFSGGNPVLLAADWLAGVQFNFGGAGVDHFRILGIDGLPDGQPFVAALTFVSEGAVDIQATPILQTPEPPTFALAGIGLAGVVLWAWRRRRGLRLEA